MSLMHEFLQIDPAQGEALRLDDNAVPYDACRCPVEGRAVYRLHDDVIGRNAGRIDDLRTDDWSGMAAFEPGRMRYFSGFTGITGGRRHAGLNYYGITLLDEAALQYLIAPISSVGEIAHRDRRVIRHFRDFCSETLKRGLWLVHFGI